MARTQRAGVAALRRRPRTKPGEDLQPPERGIHWLTGHLAGPPDARSLPSRQPRDHEVVAVLEQLEERLVGDRPVEGDRDPMALVEVVARLDRGIGGAQSLPELRLALEADPQG